MSTVSSKLANLYDQTYTIHDETAIRCESCIVIHTPALTLPKDENWWIQVFTAHPACMYYFGIFANAKTAETLLPKFIEDLVNVGAKGLVSRIYPQRSPILTINQEQIPQFTHFPPGIDIL